MVKAAAILFGLVFLVVGILGFVPAATNNEMLLGIFHVNLAHNIVRLASGAIFLLCGMAGRGHRARFSEFPESSTPSWLRSDSTTAMNQSLAWLPTTPLMFGCMLGWRS
jgi:hypothetical protein